MAKAAITETTVVKKSIVLELSEAEANTLRVVLARVGGDRKPAKSPREHTESIARALWDAGQPDYTSMPENRLAYGSFMFRNYPDSEE